jgi:hypothetical protein
LRRFIYIHDFSPRVVLIATLEDEQIDATAGAGPVFATLLCWLPQPMGSGCAARPRPGTPSQGDAVIQTETDSNDSKFSV